MLSHAFIGPSLRPAERPQLEQVIYHSPLCPGDLDCLPSGARVLIVDGFLDEHLMISKDQLLAARQRGCDIRGTSSTGAILAAKYADIGVTGTGRIFEYMRAQREHLESLVAVLLEYPSLDAITAPLINPLLTLADSYDAGLISFETTTMLEDLFRSIPLSLRTEERFRRVLRGFGLSKRYRDYKAQDAMEALMSLTLDSNDARVASVAVSAHQM